MNNIIKLSDSEVGHYELEQRTANLIKECYKLQCGGNKLTPEKIHALCQLTWWTGDKIKPLKILFNISDENHLRLEDLKEIPKDIKELIKNEIGFVKFYNAWRKSSLEWICENFILLSSLVHKAAEIETDEDAMSIIREMEKLPKIPKPNKKEQKIPPINLLSPLFACLDPRNRFPIINGNENVTKLHNKLGIKLESLENKFNVLIGLIGQYGIKDTLMLDVVSGELAEKVIKQNKPKIKYYEKEKALSVKDDSDIEILAKSLSKEAKRIHNSMTNALRKKIEEKYKFKIFEGPQNNKYDALIKNYDNNGRDLLIEVKSSPTRAHLRLAVGQLFDYRRMLNRRAVTDMAILLPEKPDQDSLNFLMDIGIIVMWFSDSGFKNIEGTKKIFR